MSEHTGKPSGANKSEGTGIPSNFKPEDPKKDKEVTDKYTDDDKDIKEGIRSNNPNRNTDNGDATNAHGYKN